MRRSAPLWLALAALLLACLALLAFRVRPSGATARAAETTATRDVGEPSGSAGPATIRIGSYNMAMFGLSKEKRPATMEILARIGSSFDLLAMQEVGSNGSSASDETCAEVMDAYLALVNEVSGGEHYAYVRGDQYALLYRKDRLELKSSGPYSGAEAFTYRPLVAYFQVRGRPLDFAVITVHTRPSLARREIPGLAAAMDEVSASLAEPDVLCLGDFNADGSYYDEAGTSVTAASAAMAAGGGSTSTSSSGQSSTWLAGFSPDRFETLIPNGTDTTVASGTSCTYDRMEISANLFQKIKIHCLD